MIKLQIEKYCERCSEFEPDVEKTNYKDMQFTDYTMSERRYFTVCDTTIRCKHRDRCREIADYMRSVESH